MSWASSPRGLTAVPTSAAITTLVTRGFFGSVASISTRQATQEPYSSWTATPCAWPDGRGRPQFPAAATLSSTALTALFLSVPRRKATGSLPSAAATSSTTISSAVRMVPESTDRQAPSGIASSTEPELPDTRPKL